MPDEQQLPRNLPRDKLIAITNKVNETLNKYSDKDFQYSRIFLQIKPLESINGPYALWYELVSTTVKQGRTDLRAASDEVTWGERHSHELGILEIISLRLNKALLALSSDELWGDTHPIIRVTERQLLAQQGVTEALWYEVQEVSGEEFDSR